MLLKIIRTFNFKQNSLELLQKRLCSLEVPHILDTSFVPKEQEQCNTRLLKLAVIGCPNSGKSTFINGLMDRKVCATSSKVHTTRGKAMAVFTEGDAQIVFLDTPGLVNDREKKKFKLEATFIKDSKTSIEEADMVGVIHDVSDSYTKEILDIKIIKLLDYHKKKPSFLVLNKIDLLKSKRKLLDLTRILTENCLDGKPFNKVTKKVATDNMGWPYFKEIFMVSALTGSGLSEVKDYLIKSAKPNKWMFSSDEWTNQSPETIILRTVQAKFLDFLPQEIPYRVKPEMELFERDEESGAISCVVLVMCPSPRIIRLIAGASEGRLRQITESVQHDLQLAFQNFVRIKIVLEKKRHGPEEEK